MPFCPNCGIEPGATHQFCRNCGWSLAASVAGSQTIGPAQIPGTGARFLPYYLSPTRILVMGVLSYGLYIFYWFYLTWKQYRDHTGQEAFPIWHALTLLVPIYGLFRIHAHVRSFKELIVNSGRTSTLSPVCAVGLVAISEVLDAISFNVSGGFFSFKEMRQSTALAVGLFNVLSITVVAGLLLQLQGNLNRYWSGLAQLSFGETLLTKARIGLGENILLVVGLLFWLDTSMTVFSAGYRAFSSGG